MIGVWNKEQRKNVDFPLFNEFFNAEDVWFWCCRCRMGEATKFFRTNNQQERICETNDVYLIVKKLQAAGKLCHRHIKILVKYGIKQTPPSNKHGDTVWECQLWQQAMEFLGKELKERSILI